MRHVTGYALAAAVVLLAVVTLAQRAPQAQAGPAQSAVRWEYAALRFKILTGGKWEWRTPTESRIEDKSSIYRALGGQGHTNGDVSYVDIATQASQQGWEVLTVLEREGGTELWFKRPAH